MADRTPAKVTSKLLTELWWLRVVQAIVAILFGIVGTFWPGLTLVTLVYLLSAFVVAIGLTEVVRGLMNAGARDTWWMTLIIGIVTFGVGVYLARHPDVSFATFIVVVGVSFIVWGVMDVVRAFIERIATPYKVLTYISGLAGVAAGIITLSQPAAGGLAFVWVLGLYAFIYGIVALAEAIDHYRDYVGLKDSLTSR